MTVVEFHDLKSFLDLPAFHFLPPKKWSCMGEKSVTYCDQICAFDIETTTITDPDDDPQSVMYVWQFAIGPEYVIIGRTWDQFKKLVSWLNYLANGHSIVVFVHNLSYEFQFLSGIFHFENEDVFAVDSRKILKASVECLEFRCSYLLSNLNLSELTKRYGVEHKKLSGYIYDYSKPRFSHTELTEYEKDYIINDVVGLLECVQKIMDLYEDDVYSLPLTSTGFVRRICKTRMKPFKDFILGIYPDYDLFKMLRAEFRGGNTHANRFFTDEVIEEEMKSLDISSSYPSSQTNRPYPITPFQEIKNISRKKIEKLIDNGYAVLFNVELYDVQLKDKFWPVPYIPLAKCGECSGFKNDNGRILWAEYLTITVNDIDWSIIKSEYKFSKAVVTKGYFSSYGPLPRPLVDCNIEFYQKKTALKGDDENKLIYSKNKELLNSLYLWNDSHFSCKRQFAF